MTIMKYRLYRAQDTVNVYGLGEIFQVLVADSPHMITLTQAADGLWYELCDVVSGTAQLTAFPIPDEPSRP